MGELAEQKSAPERSVDKSADSSAVEIKDSSVDELKAAPEGISPRSQQTLNSFIRTFLEIAGKDNADPNKKVSTDDLDKIEKEIFEGRIGEKTLTATKTIADWLGKSAVPKILLQLQQEGVDIPPNGPYTIPPSYRDGKSGAVDFLRDLSEGIANNTFFERTKEQDALRLDNSFISKLSRAVEWVSESNKEVHKSLEARKEKLLENEIVSLFTDDKGLVKEPDKLRAWLDKSLFSEGDWAKQAKERLDLIHKIKDYAYAQEMLASTNPKLASAPPDGVKVSKAENGNFKVDIELTPNMVPGRPEFISQSESWQKWLKERAPQIDQMRSEYLMAMKDSSETKGMQFVLSFQLMPVQNGFVRLNSKNEVEQLLAPNEVKEGDKKYNIADTDLKIRKGYDENGQETVFVKPQLQLRVGGALNYLDAFAAAVGQPIDLPERRYKPDDFVMVNDGHKPQFIQAKDLENWLSWQKIFHRSEKVLTAAMDATLLATGTIEFAGATRVGSKAAWHMVSGLYHASVGASGVINNAYFRESEGGQFANEARGYLFLATASLDLTRLSLKAASKNFVGASASGTKISESAMAIQKELEATKWAAVSEQAGKVATWSGAAFVPIMYRGAEHAVNDLVDAINKTPDSLQQSTKYMTPRELSLTSGDGISNTSLTDLNRTAKQLEKTLPKEALSLISKAAELNSSGDAKAIDAFKISLMDLFKPNKDKIVNMGVNRELEGERASSYLKYRSQQDQDRQLAAAIALIHLSRKPDGKINDPLVERTIDLPAYMRHQETKRFFEPVKAEREQQQIKIEDLSRILSAATKRTENEKDAISAIAAGELLLNVQSSSGYSARDYANTLSKIASTNALPESTRAEALVRIGDIAAALATREQNGERKLSSTREINSASLNQALHKIANDHATSEQLRMLAAGISFANRAGSSNEQRAQFRSYFADSFSKSPADFAQRSQKDLEALIASSKTTLTTRVNAAETLQKIGRLDAYLEKNKQNDTVQSIGETAKILDRSRWIAVADKERYQTDGHAVQSWKETRRLFDSPMALEILDKAEQFTLAGSDQQKQNQFKGELLGQLFPDGKELADGQLGVLVRDKQAQVAALLALSRLSTEASNGLVAKRTVEVPASEMRVVEDWGNGPEEKTFLIPAKTVEQSLSTAELSKKIEALLSDQSSRKSNLALVETLLKMGTYSGQELVGSLQDIVKDGESSSSLEKVLSLMQLAKISSNAKLQNDFNDKSTISGSSSADIERFIREAVRVSSDPTVKAAAAGIIAVLSYPSAKERNELIQSMQALALSDAKQFSVGIERMLKEDANSNSESAVRAALLLKDLADKGTNAESEVMQQLAELASIKPLLKDKSNAMAAINLEDMSKISTVLRLHLADNIVQTMRDISSPGSRPQNASETSQYIDAIAKLVPSLSGDQRSEIEQNMISIADSGSQHSAETRITAIRFLQEMGSQSSIATLDKLIAGTPAQPELQEPNGSVRLAALKASIATDPLILSKSKEWARNEKDPIILAELQDLIAKGSSSWSPQSIDGDRDHLALNRYPKSAELLSAAANEIAQASRGTVDLQGSNKEAEAKATNSWLSKIFSKALIKQEEYDKLSRTESEAAAKQVYSGVLGTAKEIISSSGEIANQKEAAANKKIAELSQERLKQFEKLHSIAKGGGADALLAKLALLQALEGNPDSAIQSKMTKIFQDLLDNNSQDKDVLLRGMAKALSHSRIADDTRAAFVEILSKQTGNSKLSKAQVAEATLSSLRLMWDINVPKPSAEQAMNRHIEVLKQLQYRPASALIIEMARENQDSSVSKNAQSFLDALIDGTEPIWSSVVSDKLADVDARARHLEKSLKNASADEEIVKLIAVSTKDLPLQGTSDPRLQLISERMTNANDLVRVAAGRAILESNNDGLPEYELAKKLLAALAVSSGNPSLKKEALKALAQIKSTKP